uniref:DUF1985 domain-containing protein n=1 Tax=Heterorhabditis bacteriophora TaxID=37862 RepID=A0A1I7WTA4_HETBA
MKVILIISQKEDEELKVKKDKIKAGKALTYVRKVCGSTLTCHGIYFVFFKYTTLISLLLGIENMAINEELFNVDDIDGLDSDEDEVCKKSS